MRKTLAYVFVVWTLASCFNFVYSQSDKQKGLLNEVELASFEYPLQFSKMRRYLAVVSGAADTTGSRYSTIEDFRYVYAYAQGKSRSADKERAEIDESLAFDDGSTRESKKRSLKTENHVWLGNGDGNVTDFFSVKKEEYSKMVTWDPFSMPINFWGAMAIAREGSYRDIAVQVMQPGNLFDAETDSQGRFIGRWRDTKPKELGYNEVVFDPKFGNMPTEMRVRELKPGYETVDPQNLVKCTTLYQESETKWFQHTSGKYLPSEVHCVVFRGKPSGWKIQIEWWLDDEVPDEVFTVEDLLKSHLKASVVDQLADQRKELKAEAERKGKQVNEKK